MPIVAWDCPICEHKGLELDHFTGPCGDKIHPDYPEAILRHEKQHHRFGKRVIGVTDVIGCPRRATGQREVDYSVDPTSLNSMSTGSAWDAWVTGDREKKTLSGVFDGVHIVGEPDRIINGKVRDWKHSTCYSRNGRKKDGPKDDHRCQISMYTEMLRQGGDRDVGSTGILDYHFSVEYMPGIEVDLMPMDEILEYKPTGGPTTIREHLHMMDDCKSGHKKWMDLPLTGELQHYGAKQACDYCVLRERCWKLDRGTAF